MPELARMALACLAAAALAGCHTPDQQRLAASVHALLAPGIDATDAVRRLHSQGFLCDGPARAPTCSRTRQRLLPSTCIERVNLVIVPGTGVLETFEVAPIRCAGF